MRQRETWWTAHHLTTAVFVMVIALGCKSRQMVRNALVALSPPECPKYGVWSTQFAQMLSSTSGSGTANGSSTGLLAIAGTRTDMPEYNDCQQFITHAGTYPAYISLFAIFSREHLADSSARFDAVPDTAHTHADSMQALKHGKPLVVGEIWARDSTYATLGIETGFNCLFLYSQFGTVDGLEAKVVPVGTREAQCLLIADPRSHPGTTLDVLRHRFSAGDVPDVARLDWDATKNSKPSGSPAAMPGAISAPTDLRHHSRTDTRSGQQATAYSLSRAGTMNRCWPFRGASRHPVRCLTSVRS